MFLGDLKILGHEKVERKVERKSRPTCNPDIDVLLQHVDGLVREAVAQFDVRVELEFPRQSIHAPEQETVGNFIG